MPSPLLPALLAVFWGVATGVAALAWREDWRRILVLAVLLSLAEFLRGTLFTGFPWNTIGYAAMPSPVAMQTASVLGLYGVTVLAVPVFAVAALRPLAERRRRAGSGRVCAFVPAGGRPACGLRPVAAIGPADAHASRRHVLRIVQPDIAQAEKWAPAMERRNFRTSIDLSMSTAPGAEAGADAITHIVWPESAFPFVLTERPDALPRWRK